MKELFELIARKKALIAFWTAVVVVWVVLMGSLIKREYWIPNIPGTGDLIARWDEIGSQPLESWMAIQFQGRTIGYSHSLLQQKERIDSEGEKQTVVAIMNETKVCIAVLGETNNIHIQTGVDLDRQGEMQSFQLLMNSEGHRTYVTGTRYGNLLETTINVGGRSERKTIDIEGDSLISDIFNPMTMLSPDLEPGIVYGVQMLDPLSLTPIRAKLRLVKEETVALDEGDVVCELVELDYHGALLYSWIDLETGEVLRVDTPLGLRLEKVRLGPPGWEDDPCQWLDSDSLQRTGDLAKKTAVLLTRVPADFTLREEVCLMLSGFPVEDYADGLAGPRQTLEGHVVRIRSIDPDLVAASSLSFAEISKQHRQFQKDLDSTFYVQANDSGIQRKTAEIVAGETDTWEAAQRIHEWVYSNVRKKITFSVPSAVEVFRTLSGDCNEHTVLFAAMARAAGIPTRIIIGLVYSDQQDLGESRYYYHAWPEVYVGTWVPMDPTLGQTIADVRHVRLIEGEIAAWIRLLGVVGQMRIEIQDCVS